MNPFTQSLLARLEDSEAEQFVQRWDELEALVIRVYRRGEARPDDLAAYRRLRAWLTGRYPQWRPRFFDYWQGTRVAGQVAREDPFEALFKPDSAGAFVDNWLAMQTLPAAREGLNGYLLARLEGQT